MKRRLIVHPNPHMLTYCGMANAYVTVAKHNDAIRKNLLAFTSYLNDQALPKNVGEYTAITQTISAIAEALIDEPRNQLSEHSFAKAFVRQYKKDPRPGYNKIFSEEVLEPSSRHENSVVGGHQLLQFCRRGSDKNGAAMRAIPIGIFARICDVLEVTRLQAAITHNTPGGIFAAQIIALLSHYALYETAPFTEIPEYLTRLFGAYRIKPLFPLFSPWAGPVGTLHATDQNLGIQTAHAVCTLLTTQNTLLDIMRQALLWGADTDSVATIAWGIASARYHNEKLPDFFQRDFENGPFGKNYLETLGHRLMARAKK